METKHPGGSPAAPLLQVDGVTLAFGGVKALTGVGFDVQPGSITAVIGPNGAGKTSLFNTISGFYRPTGGSIRFKGQDITRIPAPQRARMGLGRSFQNIALFRGMTVLDNIKLGRHAHLNTNVLDALLYFGRARREEAALRADIEERIIDFLEIDHIRHAPVSALSYGLQKRVEMARALAMQPQILMLDEPVAGMNREERGQLKDIMITAGGKNLTPSEIENTMKGSPYIKECIVVADGRKFVSALVMIDYETVGKWAEAQRLAFTHFRSLVEMPQVRALIEQAIAQGNERLAQVSHIRKFHLLTKELDHDDGEVTATMKVRRSSIYKTYAAEIEALYR